MKKLVMLVLAIAMLALPVMAMADVSVNTWSSLVTAVNDGEKNITLTAPITIGDGSEHNLKSEGVTITANGQVDAFTVTNGSTLNLKGISVNSDTSILYAWGGTINVENGTFNSTGAGTACAYQGGTINVGQGATISGSSNQVNLYVLTNSTASVNAGGTVTSSGCTAVSVEDNSTLTVNGGTVETTKVDPTFVGIFVKKNGTLAVKSGTVKAAVGEAICTNEYGLATVTITGGDIIGGKKGSVYVYDGAKVTVSGGSFSDDKAEKYVVPGLTLEKKGNMWHVAKIADIMADADLPQTGDTENLMMWVALMAMAAVGLIATRKMSRE